MNNQSRGNAASIACRNRDGFSLTTLIAAAAFLVVAAQPAHAQHVIVNVIHEFRDGSVANDGNYPDALASMPSGSFLGTSLYGGSTELGLPSSGVNQGFGTAFQMASTGSVTILHSFNDGSVLNDGVGPISLVKGTDGNYYGTTANGGSTRTTLNAGAGTFFRLTPTGTVTILHSFEDGSVVNDGDRPGPIILGSDGNFYGATEWGGATQSGGSTGLGTVFKASPGGQITILHSFGDQSVPNDGATPLSGLIQATDGNFYGTTSCGGSTIAADPFGLGYGCVYKITPSGSVTILHSFRDGGVPGDGYSPSSMLVQASDGNLYGTTSIGGSTLPIDPFNQGYGTIFKITLVGTETVLHSFSDGTVANDGRQPADYLSVGADGYLYGVTNLGGSTTSINTYGYGTIFRSSLDGSILIIHSFGDGSVVNDGRFIACPLWQASDGDFYGVTDGGFNYPGTAFSFSPTLTTNGVASIAIDAAAATSGTLCTGTVTLVNPAPAGGASVILSSSDPSDAIAATQTVLIPAGATSASFPIYTQRRGDARYGYNPNTVILQAGYNGLGASTKLTVYPKPAGFALSGLTISPSTVTSGQLATATISFTVPSPPAKVAVTLISTKRTDATPTQTTVTTSVATSSCTVPIITSNPSNAPETITIKAIYAGVHEDGNSHGESVSTTGHNVSHGLL